MVPLPTLRESRYLLRKIEYVIFKKMPHILGKLILWLIALSIIKHLLASHSINIIDPFLRCTLRFLVSLLFRFFLL